MSVLAEKINNGKIVTKPFLRWAGGKKWLLDTINEFVRIEEFNSYYEPFLGGASVFFDLNPKGKVFLSDTNKDLINTYQCVKNCPEDVWSILSKYKNTEHDYYIIRSEEPVDEYERAARFIYLNQTSFNGLYRVNREGKYNVPYGKRKNVSYNRDGIIAASRCLQNADLSAKDFEKALNMVEEGDLVFLDPPYVVAKDINGFIQYNRRLFSFDDQKRLSKCIDKIKANGGYYILTNAKHDTIREIFDKPGDLTLVLSRASLIGGKKAYRGKTEEYLFTNIPEAKIILEKQTILSV